MATRRSSGEGSIVQRKDGRWQASLQVAGVRTTVYGKTRREAAAKLAVLQRQAPAPALPTLRSQRTLDELLDAWLEVKAPQWRPRTLADAREVCDQYLRPALGALPLARLTPEIIQRLYAPWQSAGKARTALKLHRTLAQALDLAVRWGWLAANPCKRVEAPRYHPPRRAVWSPAELRCFLEGVQGHWLRAFWVVAIATGCRLGELLRLTWADIDGARVTIVRSKTLAGERSITLPAEASAALDDWCTAQQAQRLWLGPSWRAGELVFSSRRGAPLAASTVEWMLAQLCERLALPRLTPHGLRHLHASLLLAQGLPIPAVSKRLGHANAAITMAVYAHAMNQDDSAATEAIAQVFTR